MTRYQCALCKCWGYREWTSNRKGIQVYLEKGKPRMTPVSTWYLFYGRPTGNPPHPPRILDVGLIESLAPSNEMWHKPR